MGYPTVPPYQLANVNVMVMVPSPGDPTNDAIDPASLTYVADAGTRWAYHSVFFKLQDVIAQTTGQTWDNYFNLKLL